MMVARKNIYDKPSIYNNASLENLGEKTCSYATLGVYASPKKAWEKEYYSHYNPD